jgi:hypothetical protein
MASRNSRRASSGPALTEPRVGASWYARLGIERVRLTEWAMSFRAFIDLPRLDGDQAEVQVRLKPGRVQLQASPRIGARHIEFALYYETPPRVRRRPSPESGFWRTASLSELDAGI